jgi:hypothetical protein
MPTKSAESTTRQRANQKSERLELATAISNLTSKQDAFIKAIDVLENFKAETLTSLDLQIDAKKLELNALSEDYKHQMKSGEIETDQYLAEYKYNGALEVLKKSNEIPIGISELNSLRTELEKLREDRSEELEALKKKERERSAKELNAVLNNSQLKHKAEIATLTASVDQQKKEISTLQSTIQNLQHELAEQRKLTKDVAEASRQGAVTVNSAK